MKAIIIDNKAIVESAAVIIKDVFKIEEKDLIVFSYSDIASFKSNEITNINYAFIAVYDNYSLLVKTVKLIRSINRDCIIIFLINESSILLNTYSLNPDIYLNKKSIKRISSDLIKSLNRKPNNKKLKVRCFGNFDIYDEEIPIKFRRSKTKELFAYLIYKDGKEASIDELCAVLYPNDENDNGHKSTIRVSSKELKDTLSSLGYDGIYVHRKNSYLINKTFVDCDYYDWLDGKIKRNTEDLMFQYGDWVNR